MKELAEAKVRCIDVTPDVSQPPTGTLKEEKPAKVPVPHTHTHGAQTQQRTEGRCTAWESVRCACGPATVPSMFSALETSQSAMPCGSLAPHAVLQTPPLWVLNCEPVHHTHDKSATFWMGQSPRGPYSTSAAAGSSHL